jgi:hypothetical protein
VDCTFRHRRVVIVAAAERAASLAALFQHPSLSCWSASVAESCEHARFLTRLPACDALLADEAALGEPGEGSLEWLSAGGRFPVVLLSSPDAGLIGRGLAEGAQVWLPRELVLEQPDLLAAGLRHARQTHLARRRLRRARRQARAARTQVGRLADLLWTSLPVEGRPGWLSQRFVLERLHEEVLRCDRHGSPLTVVRGEWAVAPSHDLGDPLARPTPGAEAEQRLRDWTLHCVLETKRRSDVAGQYGLRGFLLVLPHTPDVGAAEFCRRLREDLSEPPPDLPSFWRLHTALGVAGYSGECRSPKSILRLAEERLEGDHTSDPQA